MISHFSLTDNPQEIEINGTRIPFNKRLCLQPQDFVKEANKLLSKHRIEFPSNFSAEVEEERYTLKQGIQYPTSINDFEKRKARVNHMLKLPPFFINCIRLENEFNIDTNRFLKELIQKPGKEGLLHNGSLLIVASSYAEQGYTIKLWPSGKDGHNPDLLIEGIKSDVKYISEADFLWRILQTGEENIYFLNNYLRAERYCSPGEDICFNIGKFISNRCYDGILQADMLFADFSEKYLRDLERGKHSKPKFLPSPRACRIAFFSWSIYEFN